jgi:hypothetical protein
MITGVYISNTIHLHLFKHVINTFVRLVGIAVSLYLIELLMLIVGMKTERDTVEF